MTLCYLEQYVGLRLKGKVFSPRRKADVDFVLFSSVGSWFHARGAAVEMLDPPFFGSSVARHSLRDCYPAVRTGMKWQ